MINVRDRRSSGVSRERLTLELRRGFRPLIVGLVGIAVALASLLFIFSNVGKQVYTPSREFAIDVENAAGVVGGGRQELRFKGVRVGTITKAEVSHGRARIGVKMFKSFGPVYRDARLELRPNSALEDMYVDILDRGSRSAGVATVDHPLAAAQTRVGVQAEDVLQTFEPGVRNHLAGVLRDLGGGTAGRGDDLRRAIVALRPFVDVVVGLTDQLQRRSAMTRSLIADSGALTAELANRDTRLRSLVDAGQRTFETLNASAAPLDRTLGQLPGTLEELRRSTQAVSGVVPDVDTVAARLVPVAKRLPKGLRAIRDLTDDGDPALRALRGPVKRLRPLSDSLRPLSTNLDSVVSTLRPEMPALDYVTRSVAGCATAIQGFFQWTASTLKFADPRGVGIRGDAVVDLESVGGLVPDPNGRYAGPNCAPGTTIGGTPGPGGTR